MDFTYFLLQPQFLTVDQTWDDINDRPQEYRIGYVRGDGGRHPRDVILMSGYDESSPPEWLSLTRSLGLGLPEYSSVRYSMLILVKARATISAPMPQQPANTPPIPAPPIVVERIMAVTAGSAWTYLSSNQFVHNFGKNVVLNWTTKDGLTELDTENPGERGKRTSQKLHNPGSVGDFAVFEDLYNVLKVGSRVSVGTKDESIQGGRSVRFRGDADLSTLIGICDKLLEKFLDDANRPREFADIERVEELITQADKDACEVAFFTELLGVNQMDIGFAEPKPPGTNRSYWLRYKDNLNDSSYQYHPITDWRTIQFRTFLVHHLVSPARQQTAQISTREQVTFPPDPVTYKAVGSRRLQDVVSYISVANGDKKWIISDGGYFRVAAELHDRLNDRVRGIPKRASTLPALDRGRDTVTDKNGTTRVSEGAYNSWVCKTHDPTLTNFDVDDCRKVINRSKVEVCDIFDSGTLFCVKRDTVTSKVAELCKQVADSAVCLQSYDDYWVYLSGKLVTPFAFAPKADPSRFTFILAFVTNDPLNSLDELPLKAKLAVINCMQPVYVGRFGLEFMTIPYV